MATKNDKKALTTEETAASPVPQTTRISSAKVLWLLAIFGAGWGIYENPKLVSRAKEWFGSVVSSSQDVSQLSGPNVYDLQNQIALLQNEIFSLKNQLRESNERPDAEKVAELYNKFEAIEQNNLNIIKSKADASTVLGVVGRLDNMERKLQLVSKTSDESALILTAAMLVKEAAFRGGSFSYEAEVLQQLAQNAPQLSEPLAVIDYAAKNGIVTNIRLINEFESIYKALLKKQKDDAALTWKDRVMNKLNEFVKIKKVNEAEKAEMAVLQNLKDIRALVQEENFAQAAAELEMPENANLREDPDLQKWLKQVQAKIEFERAINKISTHSLAVMKVNAIKKEIKE